MRKNIEVLAGLVMLIFALAYMWLSVGVFFIFGWKWSIVTYFAQHAASRTAYVIMHALNES